MPIDKSGFLGDEVHTWIEKHRTDNREWLEVSKELNTICLEALWGLTLNAEDERGIACATLLMKALDFYQSAIIILERGIVSGARVTMRSLSEAMYAICAITKNEDIFKDMVFDDINKQIKLCNLIIESPESYGVNEITEIQSKKADCEKMRMRLGVKFKNIPIERIARIAETPAHYNLIYRGLSETTHADLRDLELYFKLDENRKIEKLLWGPSVKGLDRQLAVNFETMLIASRCFFNLFSLDGSKLDELRARFEKLFDSLSSEMKLV